MSIKKLKRGYSPSGQSGHFCRAGLLMRWVLVGFGLFLFLSVGIAIGYVSRVNVDMYFNGNG